MNKRTKKRFKQVYYIVQVVPVLKICGYTFDSKRAKALSQLVKDYTGTEGRIIKFSRQQLAQLNLTSSTTTR